MTRFTKITSIIAVAIAMAIFVPSAAAYHAEDLPVAGATSQSTATQPQDERSPDAIDAARAIEVSPAQDERSPDAVNGVRASTLTPAGSAGVSPSRSGQSTSDAFEWGDAGLGAAIMLALLSLCGGVVLLIGRRRRRRGYVARAT